jgi:Ca-activated chloride channel family protein
MVNLTAGNIRPGEAIRVDLEILAGADLHDDGFRFRFPFALAPAYHSRAKAVERERGIGEIELPRDEFGDVILPEWRKDAAGLHQVGFELAVLGHTDVVEISSASHAVRVRRDGSSRSARIALATEADVPDRDLVVDVKWAESRPHVLAGRGSDGQTNFAAIVPSSSFGSTPQSPRRIAILMDRSGSMEGTPIAQARKAIDACLAVLSERDFFGLVAFDDTAEAFRPALVPATRDHREGARKFLAGIDARGGTSLAKGFVEAAKILDGCGDVLILTDGQVSGTEQILSTARETGARLHCLGIGSASQDRFLTLLARETGGISRFVTPSERVDLAAVDLFASIGRPLASNIACSPAPEPLAPPAIFTGAPLLLFGRLDESHEKEIALSWDGGALRLPVALEDGDAGECLRLLRGARLITDCESRYPAAAALAPLERRKTDRVAMRLKALSEEYGLASREMSLVAVVKREGDRPGDLPETRVVPAGMPFGTAFGAYFSDVLEGAVAAMSFCGEPTASLMRPRLNVGARSGGVRQIVGRRIKDALRHRMKPPAPDAITDADHLLALAAEMEPDGGMPGKDRTRRAMATALALLAFLSQGHTLSSGTFRSHVARLVAYLEGLASEMGVHRAAVAAVVTAVRKGRAPAGDWLKLARTTGDHWEEIEKVAG